MPNLIRERRIALGLTVVDLSRASGLSISTVLRAEHGTVRSNRSTVACLAVALGCRPDELKSER